VHAVGRYKLTQLTEYFSFLDNGNWRSGNLATDSYRVSF
jgi:hypothetical protein